MSQKFICPICRKSYKRNKNSKVIKQSCCGYKLICIGHRLKPPKKNQIRKWKKFVRQFLPPAYPYWIDKEENEKKSIYALWLNLGLRKEFIEILNKTEKIYYEEKEKNKSYTEIALKVSNYLKNIG